MEKYFVMWREDYDDHYGWFSEQGVKEIVRHIEGLDGESESEIQTIIEGVDAKHKFTNKNS